MQRTGFVVLSHLRWTWVWQRPQHLISRLSAGFDRTWFVEEPLVTAVQEPVIAYEIHDEVVRVWLEVPGPAGHLYFDDPRAASYEQLLRSFIGEADERVAWLYTPSAIELVRSVDPSLVVYDVMDDLASFAAASPTVRDQQRATLAEADVVFTGGRSLHGGVLGLRSENVHLFPSGVDVDHYAAAAPRRKREGPAVVGYVGVIDERLDLELIGAVAEALPEWEIRMVGPVAKIDPAALPQAPNLRYLGARAYDELPEVMAGFDVAMMPFASNEATRSISPTKTLEYLAAGLPVVSTPVPDVVTDYGHIVDIASDADAFAEACIRAQTRADSIGNDGAVEAALARSGWDGIASRMAEILDIERKSTFLNEEQSA